MTIDLLLMSHGPLLGKMASETKKKYLPGLHDRQEAFEWLTAIGNGSVPFPLPI